MRMLNLGILAHVDAGKTSLTERLLHAAGVIDEVGSVDDGSTQTDSLELERQRGITIKSAVVAFTVGDVAVNLIDTPGHPDFIAEVERVLSVLDGAVLVVSAVEGVQAQTRVLMRALQRLGVPTLIFVNKLDRRGARDAAVLEALAAKLSPAVVAMGAAGGLGTPRRGVHAVRRRRPGLRAPAGRRARRSRRGASSPPTSTTRPRGLVRAAPRPARRAGAAGARASRVLRLRAHRRRRRRAHGRAHRAAARGRGRRRRARRGHRVQDRARRGGRADRLCPHARRDGADARPAAAPRRRRAEGHRDRGVRGRHGDRAPVGGRRADRAAVGPGRRPDRRRDRRGGGGGRAPLRPADARDDRRPAARGASAGRCASRSPSSPSRTR